MSTKLEILSFQTTLTNGPGTIFPCLLHDKAGAILVDTGLPGMAGQIVRAMEVAGVPLERLTAILLTHADMDHVGSLVQLLRLCPQKVDVLCHEREKPYVQADVPPLRLSQMEAGLSRLTGETLVQMTALAQNLRANYRNLGAQVTKTVVDNDELPCGARVIATFGHTPGHICLYLQESKTLITGDMLNVEGGELMSSERMAYNLEEYRESMKKLARLDFEKVVCFYNHRFKHEPLPTGRAVKSPAAGNESVTQTDTVFRAVPVLHQGKTLNPVMARPGDGC